MAAQADGQRTALALRETSTAMVAAQAKAAVEARYTMAIHRPRDEDQAREKLLRDCARPAFAASAEYAKPVGNKTIRGASVRLVESAMRAWGNVLTETHTLYDDDDKTIVRVDVTDLESNNTYSEEIQIRKAVERRKRPDNLEDLLGERKNSYGDTVYIVRATEDDMLTKVGALRSKAIRNMGLRILPGDLIDEAMATCRTTSSRHDAADPAAARKALLDAFRSIGVSATDLKAHVGQALDALSPAQIGELRIVYGSIRDGHTTWRDVVEASKDEAERERVATAASPAEGAAKFDAASNGATPKQAPKAGAPKRATPPHNPRTGEVQDDAPADQGPWNDLSPEEKAEIRRAEAAEADASEQGDLI